MKNHENDSDIKVELWQVLLELSYVKKNISFLKPWYIKQ